ncbi:hypothetical protein DFH08DRAFT_823593 [Mycena albidolilacea]|uniref:CxC1-like cysteine cluster associated with KDZ transposases domain-containing protein n=1 Tax=Mycena albidolilacea TaxID=1033008 RepID=A0AAD6Z5N1_9AGAR|nr:hypothetical protein DFH08DRAFT_823593 [Mycena albidolilacea]
MDADGLQGLEHLQGLADDDDFDPSNLNTANFVTMEGVLNGSEQIELSHAGGELGSLEEDLEADTDDESAGAKTRQAPKAEDWRTRRDRTERRNLAFESQMPEMVASYIRYCAEQATAGGPLCTSPEEEEMRVQEVYEIRVVDMFETSTVDVKLKPTENGIAPALVREGLLPCGPWEPTVAITVRVLEAYRIQHARCPQLAIQSFVKSLCDMHGVAYRPYLCQQFSIAYDLYLDVRRRTDERVMLLLGRDSKWRLKHACPTCMYKLKGEDKLIFDMLTTMDGNDSLKRVLRRNKTSMAEDEGGEPVLGKSKERVDNRDASDGYMYPRDRVERWAKTRLAEVLPMGSGNSTADNPCADRWKNMIDDVTSKMWGIFDETGIFLALCRHGFVLVIADMIRSGELAKYPLAIIQELLDTFGMNLGAGYDIGCHFGATVENSELGEQARRNKLKCLVGSFHGHAHNRLCQLSFLATYVEGMGLEDLEGCERYFSRSNGLAKSCRYASRFHRQQEITTYAKHFDSFETYANLSKFLCTKYRQALGILKTEAVLQNWMRQEGVDDYARFHEWLQEEKDYLLGLKDAPKTNEETLEMEAKYSVLLADTRRARADDAPYAPGVGKAELARQHAKEKVDKDLETVQELERQLDIADRWTTASPRWVSTTVAIKKRKYLLALDALELLIVERIFELTKMNQSQTGYKMRKHIAKALQARSKAVRNAIDRYNSAASLLNPPMPHLTWEQVVEYAFLADFDILRDTRAEIQSRPWTRPAYRLAMDRYFKILRAREEIHRLNVEIPRVVTWIRDEDRVLRKKEAELSSTEGKSEEEADADRGMAVQVRLYRERRGRFDDTHMQRFWALAKTPGFTGSRGTGGGTGAAAGSCAACKWWGSESDGSDEETAIVVDVSAGDEGEEEGWVEEEDEGDDAMEEAVSDLLYTISMVAVDDKGPQQVQES